MDTFSQIFGPAAGAVAIVFIFLLFDLHEWIETCLKHKTPRKELEQKVADLQKRVEDLEAK